jgi:hypothetical protein
MGRIMSSPNLIRWGGLAALIGGVLLVIAGLLDLIFAGGEFSEIAQTGTFAFSSLLYLLGLILVLLGLVGLYASQSEAAGGLGLLGFLVAFLGTALAVGAFWTQAFVAPTLALEAPEFLNEDPGGRLGFGFTLTFLLASLGWLLFGVATLRAGVYPRWAAILLIIGAVLAFLPFPGTELVLAAAIAEVGFLLFTGRSAAAQPPPRVS